MTTRRLWWLRTENDMPAQSLKCAHTGRVCVCAFIGVSICVYIWALAFVLCSKKQWCMITCSLVCWCPLPISHMSRDHNLTPIIHMHRHPSLTVLYHPPQDANRSLVIDSCERPSSRICERERERDKPPYSALISSILHRVPTGIDGDLLLQINVIETSRACWRDSEGVVIDVK